MGVYTLLYLKWITGKDLLHRAQNPAQYHVAAWMGGDLGAGCLCVCVCVCVCVWLSPFTGHLELTNKKIFFKKKKERVN